MSEHVDLDIDKLAQKMDRRLFGLNPGDRVIQMDDLGESHERIVKYSPWQLDHGTWVIGLRGISGGYALSRCQMPEEV